MLNMEGMLSELARERPVFHSEADFQHVLAWKIHQKYPALNIRLEKGEVINGRVIYLDIFAFEDNRVYALELKYKTARLKVTRSHEEYCLTDQSAQNWGRYKFCKDIERLEGILRRYYSANAVAFALFLTNDHVYWEDNGRRDTADENFRIYEGRTISGELRWKNTNKREAVILTGSYIFNWRDYSNLDVENGIFKYLLVKVEHSNSI